MATKRCYFDGITRFAGLVLTVTLLLPQLSHATAVGTVPGQFSVDPSGAATYTIPIEVPPGVAGLTPNLSLVYHSRSGNGLLGMGWSLSGLSAITRCPATIVQDGFVGGINFDANDRFCLDGQRLVANGTDTIPGYAAGTKYKTELETFSKIVASGGVSSNPTYFIVKTKSGLLMEYGYQANARFYANGPNSAKFYAWALNKVQDSVGNSWSVTYIVDYANGDFRPDYINYTKAGSSTGYKRVQFFYENRSDIETSYIAGSVFKKTKRLINIKTYAGTSPLTDVRDYRVHYEPSLSPSTSRSRLANIEECGFDSVWECKPATTFGWRSGADGFSDLPLNPLSTSWGGMKVLAQGDFNGDGMTDLYLNYDNLGGNAVQHIWYGRSGADGFSDLPLNPLSTGWSGMKVLAQGDFNGDGMTDLYLNYDNLGGGAVQHIWYGRSGADGFSDLPLNPLSTSWGGMKVLAQGDFNGDGMTDLYLNYDNLGGNAVQHIWYGRSGADGFSDLPLNPLSTGWSGMKVLAQGDFNGDGMTDLYLNYDNLGGGAVQHIWYGRSGADGFSDLPLNPLSTGWSGMKVLAQGDFNGDGMTDLYLNYDNLGGGAVQHIWYGRSGADGFSDLPLNPLSTGWSGMKVLAQGDFNGDGMADVYLNYDDVGGGAVQHIWYGISGATGFRDLGINPLSASWTYMKVLAQGDFNGDGMADVYLNYDNLGGGAVQHIWYGGGLMTPDLLVNITNGLGNTASVAYKPLTDNSVYSKGADSGDDSPENHSGHPEYDFQGTMYVISAVSSDNGIGGQNTTSYTYGGARIHREGRGFLGFRWMKVANVIDAQTINTRTYFKQDYPYTGQVDYAETILNGTTLKYVDYTWAVRASDNFVYLNESTEINRELNGSFISKTRSRYLDSSGDGVPYDTYGNPEKIEVSTNTADDGVYEYVTTTTNAYNAADTTNWILGQLQRAEATNQIPGEAVSTARVSTFEYYTTGATNGLLKAEIIEPDNTNLKLRTEYTYDTYGNRNSVKLIGNTGATYPITTRTTSVVFTNVDAINPTTVTTNALTHTETKVFDGRYGVPTSLTGPNGLITSWDYDSFGRKILETRADTNSTTWAYAWCDASCPTNAVYKITNTTSGSAPVTVLYDKLGREVRSQTTGFISATVYKDTVYDAYGRVDKVSAPYFASATKYWASFTYDVLGRVRTQTTSDATVTETQYDGLHTTVYADRNNKNQRTEQWKNVLGQLVQVQDNLLNSTYYEYDPYGNLDKVTDAVGNITTMGYDIRGNKTVMDDPDMGHWEYKYDALGLLRWQKNAKLQTVTMTYDALNRLKTRVEPEGTSTWTYDTATGKGKGKIAQVTGPNSYKRVHVYDTLGREITVTTTISAVNYVVSYAYDSKSRIDTVTYPMGVSSRFAIRNVYDTNGYLKEVQNASNSSVYYWKAVGINASGQVTWETAGNNLDTLNTYNPQTDRLEAISTASGSVQSLGFGYDSLGNLLTRTDPNQGLTEAFTYDSLNRLKTAQITGYGVKSYDYNAIGNIMSKSDYATTYVYGTKPHAVTSVKNGSTTIATYAYDSNGNMTSGAGRTIGYSSYNKPASITQGTKYSNFQYGPDRTRTVQTSSSASGTSTTIYVNPGMDSGVYFEKETKGGVTSYTNYIYGGSGLIGTYTVRSNSTQSTRYFHKDHLGSIDVITNENGAVVERLSYDAFGQRRMALCGPANPVCVTVSTVTRHGFTNHEHLDEVGLIHMNGRVYDPKLGRFMSADPTLQYAASTQGLNRYSYTDNNPLSRVDMDGFNWISKKWKRLRKDVEKNAVQIVAAVVAYYVAGWVTNKLFLNSVSSQVAAGTLSQTSAINAAHNAIILGQAAGGAVRGAIIGGDLTSAVKGTFTGGFGSIDYVASSAGQRILLKSISSGVTAEMYGGDYRGGFQVGLLSGTTSEIYNQAVHYKATWLPGGDAANKAPLDPPVEGMQNVGCVISDPCGIFTEDRLVPRLLSYIPLVAPTSGLHDIFQITLDNLPGKWERTIFNFPGMPVAAAITAPALVGRDPNLWISSYLSVQA